MREIDWTRMVDWGRRLLLVVGLAASVAAGCSGDGSNGGMLTPPPPPPPDIGDGTPVADALSYFPLSAGAAWQFNLVRQGLPKTKMQTVDGTESMTGRKVGIMAVRFKEIADGNTQLTWFERKGSTIVIHRQEEFDAAGNPKWDELYEPFDVRLQEAADRIGAGGAYSITYNVLRADTNEGDSAKQKIHDFDVMGVDETITVPAGTFQTVHVRRSDPVDGSYRDYWYARGIGKVKEIEGNGDSEELAAYSGLTPAP